MTRTRKKIVT